MSTPPTNHDTIKSYLLGQMLEQDESEIETRLLADREFYDELSIVEDELIDQYLGGSLSDADRTSFEAHFVSSPERRHKVRFARALKKYVAQQPAAASEGLKVAPAQQSSFSAFFRRPVVSFALAAVLIVVAGVAFFLIRNSQGPAGRGKVLAIELTPGSVTRGGGEGNEFSIASDVGTVRLQLDLPKNEYQTYEAVVHDSALRSVATAQNLKPLTIDNFSALKLDVKANVLAPGDYRVNVSGTTADGRSESVASFSFTVRAN